MYIISGPTAVYKIGLFDIHLNTLFIYVPLFDKWKDYINEEYAFYYIIE